MEPAVTADAADVLGVDGYLLGTPANICLLPAGHAGV